MEPRVVEASSLVMLLAEVSVVGPRPVVPVEWVELEDVQRLERVEVVSPEAGERRPQRLAGSRSTVCHPNSEDRQGFLPGPDTSPQVWSSPSPCCVVDVHRQLLLVNSP